eukprot:3936393-Rhodomonas_salina.1
MATNPLVLFLGEPTSGLGARRSVRARCHTRGASDRGLGAHAAVHDPPAVVRDLRHVRPAAAAPEGRVGGVQERHAPLARTEEPPRHQHRQADGRLPELLLVRCPPARPQQEPRQVHAQRHCWQGHGRGQQSGAERCRLCRVLGAVGDGGGGSRGHRQRAAGEEAALADALLGVVLAGDRARHSTLAAVALARRGVHGREEQDRLHLARMKIILDDDRIAPSAYSGGKRRHSESCTSTKARASGGKTRVKRRIGRAERTDCGWGVLATWMGVGCVKCSVGDARCCA